MSLPEATVCLSQLAASRHHDLQPLATFELVTVHRHSCVFFYRPGLAETMERMVQLDEEAVLVGNCATLFRGFNHFFGGETAQRFPTLFSLQRFLHQFCHLTILQWLCGPRSLNMAEAIMS